jgi:sugar/nucleoside kinase (ribokinase family)
LSENKVVVIGELNVDLIASGMTTSPQLGHEVLATDFQITLGSAAAIFACGAAKLGCPVTFVSQVGEDEFGEFCLRMLRRAGIQTNKVHKTPRLKTGVTLSLSTPHDRALVTYLGAIAALESEQIPLAALDGHSHLHMTSYFLQQKLQPAFPQLFAEARRRGLTTSLDPNADPALGWKEEIRDVISCADILFVNESEARQLTKQNDLDQMLRVLGEVVACAVIKLGAKGAAAIRCGAVEFVPAFPVETVDTTGAGDSFAAGFVYGWLKRRTLRECLELGAACGALSTLQAGGTAGQPDEAQLTRFLAAMKPRAPL